MISAAFARALAPWILAAAAGGAAALYAPPLQVFGVGFGGGAVHRIEALRDQLETAEAGFAVCEGRRMTETGQARDAVAAERRRCEARITNALGFQTRLNDTLDGGPADAPDPDDGDARPDLVRGDELRELFTPDPG